MKKLGKGKGQRIHPAPPQPRDHLAVLPAAVLALAAALTAEEQEVLVYLLSSSGSERWREWPRRRAHPPELGCRCFGCYTSFWARWDASPNRHVIHHIIDAVEESLEGSERGSGSGGGGRRRRRSGRGVTKGADLKAAAAAAVDAEGGFGAGVNELLALDGDDDASSSIDDDEEETEEMSNLSKSSVGRFMSFIGETVWGVWN